MGTLGFFVPCCFWLPCLLTFFCCLQSVIFAESDNDRHALLCFKSQLSAPTEVFASWSNASLEFCSWYGVTCSGRSPRRVIALDLESESITGTISPCIANLTLLERLQLSNNTFHGSIPSELGLLSQLSNLNLSMNSLEGKIPSELSTCSQLRILGLWNNSLDGDIPSSLSQCIHLQEIILSNNKLKGSIPSDFAPLAELRILDLASNSLSGGIPPALGGTSLSLTYVDLGENDLTGGIPESLANSSSLQVLRLMSNSISGELPESLFKSSSLLAICLQENNIIGSIPPVTATAPQLKHLHLGGNHLSGTIPASLGNLSSLLDLRLTRNKLVGSIPESLGHLPALILLNLNVNNLSGPVPPSVFNMSSLTALALVNNSLVGRLPFDIGYTLPNMQKLILSSNKFHGPIPASLLNVSQIQWLYLSSNRLIGSMPLFGSLPDLEKLDVSYNMLEAGDWVFISSLSNCSKLTQLMLDGNNLQGRLPSSFGNLSSSLQSLWLRNNKISGPIPPEIGNLRSLNILYMDYNRFIGNIPPTIGNLHDLVVLAFARNRLSGQIPDIIGSLVQLTDIKLDRNSLNGNIPESIGNCTQLQILNLAYNSLNGSIPNRILKITSLSEEFDMSHNYLTGEMPDEVGNLINLNKLSISNNRMSGNIPSALGLCVALLYLEMQSNIFVGSIPNSFVNLRSIKEMDISKNNLSGKIPDFLTSLSSLDNLNLSFNNFSGSVPTGGVFGNSSEVSIEGNDHLCVSVPIEGVPFCSESDDRKRKTRNLIKVVAIVTPIVVVFLFAWFCLVTFFGEKRSQEHFQQLDERTKNITYQDIVKATNMFSPANLIGSGSFGMVYKGNLDLQEDQVAIKIFNPNTYGVHKSFLAECEAIRNLRHRNLIKIITLCSSVDYTGEDFKAIVFPYMPNGNLDMWIHSKGQGYSQRKILTLSQRMNIAFDIASAMNYLHNQCTSQLIHCDLKPSNILLDLDMVAYVSDFGLAKFLCNRSSTHEDSSISFAWLKGSIGYIPPEYGMSQEISTNGDVYSFGVLLLEMITGYHPTDEKFNEGTNLHDFVGGSFLKNINEVVDPVMLQDNINATEVTQKCIVPLVKIGLSCSMRSPKERPGMGQVSTEIHNIKNMFSSIQNFSSQQIK